jgi:hypothetical protein
LVSESHVTDRGAEAEFAGKRQHPIDAEVGRQQKKQVRTT